MPDSIKNFQNLRGLYISQNNLKSLNNIPTDELEHLAISYNNFEELPEKIKDCKKLLDLYLGNNPNNQIPYWVLSLNRLNKIGIDGIPSTDDNNNILKSLKSRNPFNISGDLSE